MDPTWWLWQRGHGSGRSFHRSIWMYAWHCSALKSWWKWESTGIAENLLVLGKRFCNVGDSHMFMTFLRSYKQR